MTMLITIKLPDDTTSRFSAGNAEIAGSKIAERIKRISRTHLQTGFSIRVQGQQPEQEVKAKEAKAQANSRSIKHEPSTVLSTKE